MFRRQVHCHYTAPTRSGDAPTFSNLSLLQSGLPPSTTTPGAYPPGTCSDRVVQSLPGHLKPTWHDVGVDEMVGDGILCADYSADGRTIATGGCDGKVRILDATNGYRQIAGWEPHGPNHQVTSVAFSLVGKQLATGSRTECTRVWDTETYQEVSLPFNAHFHTATTNTEAVVYCPTKVADAESLHGFHQLHQPLIIISTSFKGATLKCWDLSSGENVWCVKNPHGNSYAPVNAIVICPTSTPEAGTYFATTSRNNSRVNVYCTFTKDGQTGVSPFYHVSVGSPFGFDHNYALCSVGFSPDGSMLATGGCTGATKIISMVYRSRLEDDCFNVPVLENTSLTSEASATTAGGLTADGAASLAGSFARTAGGSDVPTSPDETELKNSSFAKLGTWVKDLVSAHRPKVAQFIPAVGASLTQDEEDHLATGHAFVKYSPDGQLCVSVSASGEVHVQGNLLCDDRPVDKRFTVPKIDSALCISCVAFSRDGTQLFLGARSSFGASRILHLNTHKSVLELAPNGFKGWAPVDGVLYEKDRWNCASEAVLLACDVCVHPCHVPDSDQRCVDWIALFKDEERTRMELEETMAACHCWIGSVFEELRGALVQQWTLWIRNTEFASGHFNARCDQNRTRLEKMADGGRAELVEQEATVWEELFHRRCADLTEIKTIDARFAGLKANNDKLMSEVQELKAMMKIMISQGRAPLAHTQATLAVSLSSDDGASTSDVTETTASHTGRRTVPRSASAKAPTNRSMSPVHTLASTSRLSMESGSQQGGGLRVLFQPSPHEGKKRVRSGSHPAPETKKGMRRSKSVEFAAKFVVNGEPSILVPTAPVAGGNVSDTASEEMEDTSSDAK